MVERMSGVLLMKCLLVEYLTIAGVFAYERDYVQVLYWLSAAGITTAVLITKLKGHA